MVEAEKKMTQATLGVGIQNNHDFSRNRRHIRSRRVNSTHIDPQMGILKVDNLQGQPIAT
jgi:hypothetical protein